MAHLMGVRVNNLTGAIEELPDYHLLIFSGVDVATFLGVSPKTLVDWFSTDLIKGYPIPDDPEHPLPDEERLRIPKECLSNFLSSPAGKKALADAKKNK